VVVIILEPNLPNPLINLAMLETPLAMKTLKRDTNILIDGPSNAAIAKKLIIFLPVGPIFSSWSLTL
jgi:hypothetical protein